MEQRSFVEGINALLVKSGALSIPEGRDLVKEFHDSGKVYYEEFLLEQGLVDRMSLLRALSAYFQVPAFDARGYFFDTFYLRKFEKGFLHRNVIIPLEQDEDILIVVAARPNDPNLLPEIGKNVSYDIRFYVGLPEDIMDAISEYYDKSDTETAHEGIQDPEPSSEVEALNIEREKRIIGRE